MIIHPIEPFYNEDSKILILGSFPSVKSRETGFYYGHKQNRFWKVISSLFKEEVFDTIEEKKELLRRNKIALWDVIHSCDIKGSSDSSIENVTVNNINLILNKTDIQKIYTNGRKAYDLYNKYCLEDIKREVELLPSTSPANAQYSLDKLINEWRDIISPEV